MSMNKVMVIGTNKGYGSSISQALKDKGVYVVGLSRGNGENELVDKHFPISDVSNLGLFEKEFANALKNNKDCDGVIFVPGDVLLKKVEKFTKEDIEYTINANLGYVVRAVKILKEVPGTKKILTFGSQFSYTKDIKSLAPYSIAKHLLKHFCKLLNEEGISAYHYCVPTSKTPKAEKIWRYLNQAGEDTLIEQDKWAEPDQVAPALVDSFMDNSNSKHLCKLEFSPPDKKWLVKELEFDSTEIDKKISGLTLDHFMDKEKLLDTTSRIYSELTGRKLAENEKLLTTI
jgi:short-subunit dehydrogenase